MKNAQVKTTPKTQASTAKPASSPAMKVNKNESKSEPTTLAKPVTASERINKLERLQVLADKLNYLKEKENEVEKFSLSSDGQSRENLELLNEKGSRIVISNSGVVSKVINLLKTELSERIGETETQICDFQI